MFFTTVPFLKDFEGVFSIEDAEALIKKLCSAIKKSKFPKVEVFIILPNGVNNCLVFYREDETPEKFGDRLLKEAEKHL